jgi:hypothetical protein
MDYAFSYAKTTNIQLESDYPYTAHNSQICKDKRVQGVVKVKNYYDVKENDSDALKNAIAISPVSVAIEADRIIFGQYTGGIITS